MPIFNKRNIIICFALAYILPSLAIAANSINRQDPNYILCSKLVANDKEKAILYAEAWLRRTHSITAMHCKAISLFALKRYSESAQVLDNLYDIIPYSDDSILRVRLKQQASESWRLAGNNDIAIKRLNEAMADVGNIVDRNRYKNRYMVEMLIKKAEIEDSNHNSFLAIQHLDHAYSFNVLRDKVLLARAKVYATIEDYDSSIRDIEEILLKNDSNYEAIQLQKVILLKQQAQKENSSKKNKDNSTHIVVE